MTDRRETVVNVEREPTTHTHTVVKERSNGGSAALIGLIIAVLLIGLVAFFFWRPASTPTSDTDITIETPATPPAATPDPAPAPPPTASEPAPTAPPELPPPPADAAPETPAPAPAPEPAPAPAPAPAPSP